MKKSQWDEVIDLNLTGVFLCTQVCVPAYPAQILILRIFGTETHIHSVGSNKDHDEEEKGIAYLASPSTFSRNCHLHYRFSFELLYEIKK